MTEGSAKSSQDIPPDTFSNHGIGIDIFKEDEIYDAVEAGVHQMMTDDHPGQIRQILIDQNFNHFTDKFERKEHVIISPNMKSLFRVMMRSSVLMSDCANLSKALLPLSHSDIVFNNEF